MSETCECGHPMAVHTQLGCMAYVAPPGSKYPHCDCLVTGLDDDWTPDRQDFRDRLWAESQGVTKAATEPTPCPDCAAKDALLARYAEVGKRLLAALERMTGPDAALLESIACELPDAELEGK
jgi:hypothetical protein